MKKFWKWALIVWTILIVLGTCSGMVNVARETQGQLSNAGAVGVTIGLGIWFFIWFAGAIPCLIFYFICKEKPPKISQ